ncbi:hypothetical protein [Fimbriiglobus ruber]|uniref:hypothetical protein n=1 Tax=Fimbriiglobus ruber TaxID=1908690 RepID=UPI00117BD2B1|nr:hypothetical protein [Fimbriiglobus ruber]
MATGSPGRCGNFDRARQSEHLPDAGREVQQVRVPAHVVWGERPFPGPLYVRQSPAVRPKGLSGLASPPPNNCVGVNFGQLCGSASVTGSL